MRIRVMPHFEHDERFGRGEEGWDGGESLSVPDAPRAAATPSNANLDGRVRLRDGGPAPSICHTLASSETDVKP